MLESTLQSIREANAKEIDEIMDAAMERRRQLFPDWEMAFFARPKKSLQDGEREFRDLW